MKNHKNIIPVSSVTVISVVENANTLAAAVYIPPSSCYAKLPRLPDGDKSKAMSRERR